MVYEIVLLEKNYSSEKVERIIKTAYECGQRNETLSVSRSRGKDDE